MKHWVGMAFMVALCATCLGEVSPFGSLNWTHFGNIPNTPNDSFEGPLLHLMAVDLHQDAGTVVFSVQEGVPSFPLANQGPWTTTVQITSDRGLMSYYMHLDPTTIPPDVIHAANRKLPLPAGARLGELIQHNFHSAHLHFGMADCIRRVRLNPMRFLTYADTLPPEISKVTIGQDGHITAHVFDKIDGMATAFPPNRVDLSVLNDRGDSVFRTTVFDFSELPSKSTDDRCENFLDYDSYDPILGNNLYAPTRAPGEFSVLLTSQNPGRMIANYAPHPGPLTGKTYADGDYVVRVSAFDVRGNHNETTAKFSMVNSSIVIR